MYGKFWFDGDLYVRNLDCQRVAPPVLVAFTFSIFLIEWYFFFHLWAFFFPFFTKEFLPSLVFP